MNVSVNNWTSQPLLVTASNISWTMPSGTGSLLLPDGAVLTLALTNGSSCTVTGFPGLEIHAGTSALGGLDVTTSPPEFSDGAFFGAGFAAAVAIRIPFLALRWFKRLTMTHDSGD